LVELANRGDYIRLARFIKALVEAVTGTVFVLCLFGETFAFVQDHSVASACQEIEAVFRASDLQAIVVLCFGTYLLMSCAVRGRKVDGHVVVAGADWGRAGFFVISTVVYFFEYQRASQGVQVIALVGGITLGFWVSQSIFWRSETGQNVRSYQHFLTLTIFALAMACFWNSGNGSFFYKKQARWVGPWDNPNFYGLLMASGATLALGLAFSVGGILGARGWPWKFWDRLKSALLLAAAAVICFGLWKSYSRGAWLAAGVGGLYLLAQWFKRTTAHWPLTTIHYPLGIVAVALLVVLFWQYQHEESVTVHRVISASNRNDFSWRNRVTAWEEVLQMMAERPWLGLGWNQAESYYGHYFSGSRLDETVAIQLNDYLMLGASVGIPAMFCFCMYLWLSLTGAARQETCLTKDENDRQLDSLKAVCRPGALVLAVGFWFDGGLFKLPTAATFWVLLELGREG